jgi:hypothetical protein
MSATLAKTVLIVVYPFVSTARLCGQFDSTTIPKECRLAQKREADGALWSYRRDSFGM